MLVARDQQRRWGLPDEPTVAETVATGADLVTFSGDKLLGGPQAGIAVGSRAAIEAARKHPLMRALRPDKLTLAALAATLALYRDGHSEQVPAIGAIARAGDELRAAATRLASEIGKVLGLAIAVEGCTSTVGGGAMPTAELPSFAVTITGVPAEELDKRLRSARVPVIGRIADGKLWLDVRTIGDDELSDVAQAVRAG